MVCTHAGIVRYGGTEVKMDVYQKWVVLKDKYETEGRKRKNRFLYHLCMINTAMRAPNTPHGEKSIFLPMKYYTIV